MQENSTTLDDSFVANSQSIPVPVSRWLRLANSILDGIVIDIVFIPIGYLFPFSITRTGILPIILFTFLLFWAYYFILESRNGKTVGKMITGTKVVTVTGEQPDRRTIAIRTLCRIIPFEFLSYLFSRNGWHDTLSKTVVIKG
jgi:uncharacterized RDD family membrane protein YckC